LLLAFLCLDVNAQEEIENYLISNESPKTYEIGNIKVVGAHFADDDAIISVSGLKVGQQVTIPSESINRAMKSIWKLQLFRDLEIRKTKVIDDVVFLEIEVFELPRLSSYNFKRKRGFDFR